MLRFKNYEEVERLVEIIRDLQLASLDKMIHNEMCTEARCLVSDYEEAHNIEYLEEKEYMKIAKWYLDILES